MTESTSYQIMKILLENTESLNPFLFPVNNWYVAGFRG